MSTPEWKLWLRWNAWVVLLLSSSAAFYVLAATDARPTLSLGGHRRGVAGADTFVVEFASSHPAARAIAVKYRLGGTAEPGKDYVIRDGSSTVLIPPGRSSGTLVLQLGSRRLSLGQPGRDLTIELAPDPSYRVAQPGRVVLTISSSSETRAVAQVPGRIPMLDLSPGATHLDEGTGGIQVVFDLDRPADRPVEVRYEVRSETAREGEDYAIRGGLPDGRLVFEPRERRKTITIERAGGSRAGGLEDRSLEVVVLASRSVLLGEVTSLKLVIPTSGPLRPGEGGR
jgi:hypothetical protein